ncbi:hypothetical protein [uncultured Lacinutrix sp.]|uniref:hypothetical protein n=1 Tax=uncultured Lacinutrix sp. TaxID=574032 RepID=UPI0026064F25|nr:hypothetical protein [uncultured Lacinutrix sp.]
MQRISLLIIIMLLSLMASCSPNEVDTIDESIEYQDTQMLKDIRTPPTKILNVDVNKCTLKNKIRYSYDIELCSINSTYYNSIHVYGRKASTWIYLGQANQYGNDDYRFVFSKDLPVDYPASYWTMTVKLNYVNPSTLFNEPGQNDCAFFKTFYMPATSGPCYLTDPMDPIDM